MSRILRANPGTLLSFVCFTLFLFPVSASSQGPVANFSSNVTAGCAPLVVNFTDQSGGSPTSWSWDFGNGQLSTAQNPVVNFANPGTYTVRLIVKDSAGIDDEIKTDYITVYGPPSAAFTANLTTSCAPASIQFTDLATSPAGSSVASWQWDFGDGTTSTDQSPAHTYANTGFYTVSLIITNSNGCKSSLTLGRYIRIVSGVSVDFAASQPSSCQAPFMINLQQQASGPGNLSYTWDFGNGQTSTLPNPSTIYASPGTYPVTLSVTSDLGCAGTVTKNIDVSGKSTDFTFPATICIGEPITLQNNSSPAPVSSTWTFSDGTTTSQTNPVKTFLAGGSYQVKLVNNYGNCIDSVTRTITVITSPTVDFSVSDTIGCSAPLTVQFTDQSPGASVWNWDFGDGSTSTLQNPGHTY
ncbi:MAG TPA: PKD domain-containing protein, partial [Chitinophagaceae bacterium]